MKRMIKFISVLLCSITVVATGVHAEDIVSDEAEGYTGFVLGIPEVPYIDEALDSFDEMSPLDIELGYSLVSSYIWRGQNLGSDASFQPYLTVSPSFEPFGDVSFTFWVDITKNEPGKNSREYDFVVDYTFSVLEGAELLGYNKEEAPMLLTKSLDFTFDTGYIYYKFPPEPDTKSQEVYFGIEYNLPLSPNFYIYNDWDRGRGIWYQWGISHAFDLKVLTLSTYANMGYNHKQWGTTSALSTLDFGASIPIALGTHTTIEPFLSYTKRLKPTYTDGGSDLTHDELYGGMNFSIAF